MAWLFLLLGAWLLLAIESVAVSATGLGDPGGAFVWLLLPWLATAPNRTGGIVAAAGFGLMIDCLSAFPIGCFMAVAVIAAAGLQKVIDQSALKSGVRIFCVCLACSLLTTMSVRMVTLLLESRPVNSPTVFFSIVAAAASGALAVSIAVSAKRFVQSSLSGFLRPFAVGTGGESESVM